MLSSDVIRKLSIIFLPETQAMEMIEKQTTELLLGMRCGLDQVGVQKPRRQLLS
jgi:hypothetical protein